MHPRVRVVDLVQRQQLRLLGEAVPEHRQLAVDQLAVGEWVVPRHVQDVHEHTRALDVPQELMPKANALTSALDEPRHVRRDERVVAELDDAELRLERGERVGRHLRVRRRPRAQQRRFARVRQPDEADIRKQLQFQEQAAALAGHAPLCEARCAPGGGGEALVAPAAAATPRNDRLRALGHEVGERAGALRTRHLAHFLAGVEIPDHAADRNGQPQVLARRTLALRETAGCPCCAARVLPSR